MSCLDKVVAVSNDGARHLQKGYGMYPGKISRSYLAVEPMKENDMPLADSFTLVSCSTFYSYKRIPFLIETLSRCKETIHWVHIGDLGDEKEKSVQLLKTLPANVTYSWKGFLSKTRIKEFYNATPVNLFINVSSSEGLPVTLMEAISCGIPIMATHVGGVAEIATPATGILLDKDISAVDLAQMLDGVVSKKINLPGKATIENAWKENFSPGNYEKFYKEVLCAV